MRRFVRSVLLAAGFTLLLGCGDDDGGGDESGLDLDRSLPSAGGAPAAEGADLEEAPGPVLRSFPEDLGFGEVAVAVTDASGEVRGWCVMLAETADQRQRGLMQVEDLGGYAGMLFVWDADASSSFHMRNTPMPLSIAWFDADGELVSTADMEPCADVTGCPLYPPDGAYRFALEVPQGELAELGVEEGSTLRVGGDCAPRRAEE